MKMLNPLVRHQKSREVLKLKWCFSEKLFRERSGNHFDLCLLASLLAISLCVGLGLGKIGKDDTVYFKLTLEDGYTESRNGYITPLYELSYGQSVLVDGKYEMTFLGQLNGYYIFNCCGFESEKGFLLDGGKFLSRNQPITAHSEELIFKGRIINLEEIAHI